MEGLPTKRTIFGFASLAIAIAPILAMGFVIEPQAEIHTEAMLLLFKWLAGFGIAGLGLLASAFDKYDELITGRKP